VELRRDQRWRVAIYGDILSSEHAKTRVLIHIDQLVCPSPACYGSRLRMLTFDVAWEGCRCSEVRYVFAAGTMRPQPQKHQAH
jgi:hypothetical protein